MIAARQSLCGQNQADISDFLRDELADPFVLDPAMYHIDTVASHLVAWWATQPYER